MYRTNLITYEVNRYNIKCKSVMRTHNLVVLLYRRKYLLLVEMFLTNFKRYEYGMCYLLVN